MRETLILRNNRITSRLLIFYIYKRSKRRSNLLRILKSLQNNIRLIFFKALSRVYIKA